MTTASKYAGAAAMALAGAIALTPMIAQADIAMPQAPSLSSFSKALGSSAVLDVCDPITGANCTALVAAAGQPTASASSGPWVQNNVLWSCFDCTNPNFFGNSYTPISTFTIPGGPIIGALFPGIWNWWTSQSSQTCFLGWSTTLGGPYAEPGQFRTDFSALGCNGGF